MAADKKTNKAVWLTLEAHEALRDFCERTGRTNVEVVSEIFYQFVRPELEANGVSIELGDDEDNA